MSAFRIFLFCAWILIEITAVTISIFGNSVVVYVMCSERSLRKKSSFYIISIAIADLLSSTAVVFLTIVRSMEFWIFPSYLPSEICLIVTSFFLMLSTASILQLLFVSIDRYWTVCHPISYLTRTSNFIKYAILACWIFSIIFGSTPVLNNESTKTCSLPIVHYLVLSFLCIDSAVIISVLYVLIYKTFIKLVRFEAKTYSS